MKLKNLVTGSMFECSDETGERLIKKGSHARADAPARHRPEKPKPVAEPVAEEAEKPAPQKRATTRRAAD